MGFVLLHMAELAEPACEGLEKVEQIAHRLWASSLEARKLWAI